MKKILFILVGLILGESACAKSNLSPGPLFTVTGNGKYLNISTNVPNTSYQNAGIHINTAGVSPVTCNAAGNGYCFFTVGDTQTEYFLTQGGTGSVSMILCLDARDQTNNCERHTAVITTPATPDLTDITAASDPDPDKLDSIISYSGRNFIPALGPTANTAVRVYEYIATGFADCSNKPMSYFNDNPTLQNTGLATLTSTDIPVPGTKACIALCNSNFTEAGYNTSSSPSLCTAALYIDDYPPIVTA